VGWCVREGSERGGPFIGREGSRRGCAVTTLWRGDHARGEHGEATVGKRWPRERAHRGKGCQDVSLARHRGLECSGRC
jgi:hypothetical protein